MVWNIPLAKCDKTTNDSLKKFIKDYNISENINANFRGRTISLLYDPGAFPHYNEHVSAVPYTCKWTVQSSANSTHIMYHLICTYHRLK